MIKRNRGFIAGIIKGIVKALSITAYAEEPTNTDPQAGGTEPDGGNQDQDGGQPQASSTMNFEDLLTKVRREEKEKYYKKINKLQTEKEDLVKKHNASLLKIGELQTQLEEAKMNYNSDEANKKVKELEAQLEIANSKIKEYEENTVDIEAIKEEERKAVTEELTTKFEVDVYKLKKLSDLEGSIIPELVMGDTKEQIDSSIEIAKKRFEEIQASIVSSRGQTLPSATPQASATNAFGNNATITMEEFAQLDPSSPEYAKFRSTLGFK